MRFTEIKYLKRVNLGNYEHEEITLTAVLEEDDDIIKAATEVKTQAFWSLGLSPDFASSDIEKGEEENGKQISTTDAEELKPVGQDQGLEETREEVDNSTVSGDTDLKQSDNSANDELEHESTGVDDELIDASEQEEEPKVRRKRSSSKSEGLVEVRKGRPKKVRGVAYSRENELHKKILGAHLTKNFPKWKVKGSPDQLKAKKASVELSGVPFLDDGESISPEFVKALKEIMTGK